MPADVKQAGPSDGVHEGCFSPPLTLQCDSDHVIHVVWANYGRLSTSLCPVADGDNMLTDTCVGAGSTSFVIEKYNASATTL